MSGDTVKVAWGLDDCGDYGVAGNNFWVVCLMLGIVCFDTKSWRKPTGWWSLLTFPPIISWLDGEMARKPTNQDELLSMSFTIKGNYELEEHQKLSLGDHQFWWHVVCKAPAALYLTRNSQLGHSLSAAALAGSPKRGNHCVLVWTWHAGVHLPEWKCWNVHEFAIDQWCVCFLCMFFVRHFGKVFNTCGLDYLIDHRSDSGKLTHI